MSLVTPLVSYDAIKINGVDISLSSKCRASFIAPYNKINIEMTPTNCSLSYFEVRVTESEESYDIGVGANAYWTTNIAANSTHTFTIEINSTNFSLGDGDYRISLYAKSALDDSWDVTYLFFTVGGEEFTLADGSSFEVLTQRAVPSIT
jgi:hypothetical protein